MFNQITSMQNPKVKAALKLNERRERNQTGLFVIEGYRELKRAVDEKDLKLQVTVEATHHGPTELPFPVTFVEIGSDEAAWNDQTLGETVSTAVSHSIISHPNYKKTALGVGGGHYSEKFTSLMISGEYAIGHIIPKYAMSEETDKTIFKKFIERTAGGCSSIVVDWKGTPSAFKEYLKSFSHAHGIELVKI